MNKDGKKVKCGKCGKETWSLFWVDDFHPMLIAKCGCGNKLESKVFDPGFDDYSYLELDGDYEEIDNP